MARSRAILHDPDRKLVSETLMDGQVLADELIRTLAPILRRHAHHAKATQRAQQRLTASELRAEREAWDGEKCRRQFDRRSSSVAA